MTRAVRFLQQVRLESLTYEKVPPIDDRYRCKCLYP